MSSEKVEISEETAVKVEISEEAAVAVRTIGQFTERAPDKVVLDALRVYDEVLEAWFNGKKVVILDEGEGVFTPLSNKDPIKFQHHDLAREYFESP